MNYAVANGYISGTSATTFSPDTTITRGQFVTILGRMLGVSTASGQTKFTDVKADSWYAPYIAWAADKGYVNGTSSTTFSPDTNITVEQMSTILSNYINKSGTMLKCYTQSDVYMDASSVSGWAVANVEVMRQYGLLHIDANGNVNPRKDASRAEGAFTLVKFAKAAGLGEEPTIITSGSGAFDSLSDTLVEGLDDLISDNEHEAAVKVHDELWASGKITSSMTQKQKARVCYDWLIQHCVYDTPTVGGYGSGVLVEGKGVCLNYAVTYKLFLTLEGIKCEVVESKLGYHSWNIAVLDGIAYHIDATWGDEPDKATQDKYFCMTEEAAWARFGGYAKEMEYRQELKQEAESK